MAGNPPLYGSPGDAPVLFAPPKPPFSKSRAGSFGRSLGGSAVSGARSAALDLVAERSRRINADILSPTPGGDFLRGIGGGIGRGPGSMIGGLGDLEAGLRRPRLGALDSVKNVLACFLDIGQFGGRGAAFGNDCVGRAWDALEVINDERAGYPIAFDAGRVKRSVRDVIDCLSGFPRARDPLARFLAALMALMNVRVRCLMAIAELAGNLLNGEFTLDNLKRELLADMGGLLPGRLGDAYHLMGALGGLGIGEGPMDESVDAMLAALDAGLVPADGTQLAHMRGLLEMVREKENMEEEQDRLLGGLAANVGEVGIVGNAALDAEEAERPAGEFHAKMVEMAAASGAENGTAPAMDALLEKAREDRDEEMAAAVEELKATEIASSLGRAEERAAEAAAAREAEIAC